MISLKIKAGSFMPGHSTPFSFFNRFQRGICLLALMVLGNVLSAQQPDSVNVSEFDSEVQYLGISGDTLKFQFSLGTAANPVSDALGLSVSFSFPNLQSAPTTTIVQVNGTWLAEGISNPVANWAFDESTNGLSLGFQRTDGQSRTGYGSVVTTCLIRSGGFSQDEGAYILVSGIVMVENIDLKMAPVLPEFRVFPNPVTHWVTVEVPGAEPSELSVWTLQGNLVWSQPGLPYQSIDLTALPRGSYWICVKSEGLNLRQQVVKY